MEDMTPDACDDLLRASGFGHAQTMDRLKPTPSRIQGHQSTFEGA